LRFLIADVTKFLLHIVYYDEVSLAEGFYFYSSPGKPESNSDEEDFTYGGKKKVDSISVKDCPSERAPDWTTIRLEYTDGTYSILHRPPGKGLPLFAKANNGKDITKDSHTELEDEEKTKEKGFI